MDTVTKPIFLPRHLSIYAFMLETHSSLCLSQKKINRWIRVQNERQTVYGWGTSNLYCTEIKYTGTMDNHHRIFYTDIRDHRFDQTKQSSCITPKELFWKLSYVRYTTGIPKWNVCEKDWRVFPLFHSVLGPRWASQYGLTAVLCRQEPGNKEAFIRCMLSPAPLVFSFSTLNVTLSHGRY